MQNQTQDPILKYGLWALACAALALVLPLSMLLIYSGEAVAEGVGGLIAVVAVLSGIAAYIWDKP